MLLLLLLLIPSSHPEPDRHFQGLYTSSVCQVGDLGLLLSADGSWTPSMMRLHVSRRRIDGSINDPAPDVQSTT